MMQASATRTSGLVLQSREPVHSELAHSACTAALVSDANFPLCAAGKGEGRLLGTELLPVVGTKGAPCAAEATALSKPFSGQMLNLCAHEMVIQACKKYWTGVVCCIVYRNVASTSQAHG